MPSQRRPRGPMNELHGAALCGSVKRVEAILSSASIPIDQGDPRGGTPLMYATLKDHAPVVRVLLAEGAGASIVDDTGSTALHISAMYGHLAVAKMLVEARVGLDPTTSDGTTPLHLAAQRGHVDVVTMLIDAGANVDSRMLDGATPLYLAAGRGHANAIRVLLRAKANPLLTSFLGGAFVPLDMAAQDGHTEVVRELVQQVGIKGCGGRSGGAEALRLAAEEQHMGIMAILTEAGVRDTRTAAALSGATEYGRTAAVKFLLCQQKTSAQSAYVNARDPNGASPLLSSIAGCRPSSPRIVRLLIDAGAGLTSFQNMGNCVGWGRSPLELTTCMLRDKIVEETRATEEQLQTLEAIRSLLLRVEAVYAVSWLWPSDVRPTGQAAEGTSGTKTPSAQLRMMLPVLRRRSESRGMLAATLVRWAFNNTLWF
ncbi:unnamed protein product [Pylaiella littoralis]